jgi:excisionase family DNA binding protein
MLLGTLDAATPKAGHPQGDPQMSMRVSEEKYNIKEAAKRIGISPSGVRLLLDSKKLGYYQSGKRRIIGEAHLDDYLSKIDRRETKEIIN